MNAGEMQPSRPASSDAGDAPARSGGPRDGDQRVVADVHQFYWRGTWRAWSVKR